MVKRLTVICMVVLLVTPSVSAQLWKAKRYEATAAAGTSHLYGDIGGFSRGENFLGFKDIALLQTRFNLNGSFRYFIIDNVAVRFSFTYALLSADDRRGSNQGRGYSITTSLWEPAALGEYYLVRNRERNSFLFQTRSYRGRQSRITDLFRSIDVYALTGVAGAIYNVNGNERIREVWEQRPPDMGRDGLRQNGFAAVVPLGIGAKLAFDPDFMIGVELTGRYALTDFLDGYRPLREVKSHTMNDVYHTFSVTATYRIATARSGLPSFKFK